MKATSHSRYPRYRFAAEVISHAVWLYFRFPLKNALMPTAGTGGAGGDLREASAQMAQNLLSKGRQPQAVRVTFEHRAVELRLGLQYLLSPCSEGDAAGCRGARCLKGWHPPAARLWGSARSGAPWW